MTGVLRSVFVNLLALLVLAAPAAAQCPGDPTTGNPTTRQLVLSLGTVIPATASDAMQRMATALQAQGHAVAVMDSRGPSDHKVWDNGEAWTWRSSDPVRCPTITWSPYLQAPYDGSGFSACGIPNSAQLACPSWFVSAPPAPVPVPPPVVVVPAPVIPPTVVPTPAPTPVPLTLDLSGVLARLDQIAEIEKDTNAQVAALNKSFARTIGQAAAFISKYIAPAVAAWLLAKKF